MDKPSRTAYIDIEDFYALGTDFSGSIPLYHSSESLLKHERCAEECGIFKISIRVTEIAKAPVQYEDRDWSKPHDEAAVCKRLIASYETRISTYQSEIERLRNKIKNQ